MTDDKTTTKVFSGEQLRRENIRLILQQVDDALSQRGYNAVNQISGYLISNDPAYISSHNNARALISTVDRYEIIEELVRCYLQQKQ